MAERIRIQYSAEVEELPREVGRLLEDAFNQYQLLQARCRLDRTRSIMSPEMVDEIDVIRLKLASIDHRLNDASNIVTGYLSYRAREMDASLLDPSSSLRELEDKLARFNEEDVSSDLPSK